MSRPILPRVILVAACDAEWAAVRRDLGVRTTPPMGQVVPGRGDLGLLRLGVGNAAARRSVAALREARPAVVVHVGFAGALRTGVTAGGLLLVTGVSDGVHEADRPGEEAPPSRELKSDLVDDLRSALAFLPDRLSQGHLLTVDRFVDRATLKGDLGRATTYLACEMEAAMVKTACDEVGSEYVGVRAISDAEHESVPPVSLSGLRRGGPEVLRLARWALRAQAPLEAWNFVLGTRRARAALGRAIPPTLEVAHAAALRFARVPRP